MSDTEYTEVQSDALVQLMKHRESKGFNKGFDESEIASAEEADKHITFMMVPDLCHMWALGRPGYAMGRIMQVLGPEGSAKTSDIFHVHRMAFDAGGFGAGVETEHALSIEQGRAYLGPYWDDFQEFLNQPNSFEAGLTMLQRNMDVFEKIDPTGTVPKVLSYDTIAGSGTERIGKSDYQVGSRGAFGEKAITLSEFLEHMKPRLVRTNTLLLLGNQAKTIIRTGHDALAKRKEIDDVRGQGGKSVDFATTYWKYAKRGRERLDKEGFRVKFIYKKNKLRTPFRWYETEVHYGNPFDYSKATCDRLAAAGTCGLVKTGGWFHCAEIGIRSKNKVRAEEMYEAIHAPENIGKFISALDIMMPPQELLGERVKWPKAWGDRVPDIDYDTVPSESVALAPADPDDVMDEIEEG